MNEVKWGPAISSPVARTWDEYDLTHKDNVVGTLSIVIGYPIRWRFVPRTPISRGFCREGFFSHDSPYKTVDELKDWLVADLALAGFFSNLDAGSTLLITPQREPAMSRLHSPRRGRA